MIYVIYNAFVLEEKSKRDRSFLALWSIFRLLQLILALLRGSSLCLYSGCYGGALIIEEANFSDILGIARERFKHVFLLRPTFSVNQLVLKINK